MRRVKLPVQYTHKNYFDAKRGWWRSDVQSLIRWLAIYWP